jgi:hypothetical protein
MSSRTVCARLILTALVVTGVIVSTAPTTSAAAGTISGTLRRGDGSPLPDGRVTATSFDGSVTSGADTGAGGTYTITVEPGTYCISFGTDADSPAATTYGGAPNCRAGTTPVTVGSGAAVGAIDGVVHLGGIAGTLRTAAGTPIAGARIAGDLVTTNVFISTTTSGTGTFGIKDLLPGTYCLTATVQRRTPTVVPGTPTCSAGEFAAVVVADITPTVLDIRIDTGAVAGGGISGVVRYVGLPVAGRPVTATGIDVAAYAETVTVANGTYSLAGLVPGSYCVTVGGATGSIAAGEVHRDQETCATATPVVVGSSSVPGIDFALDAGGRVGGVVTGPGGTPLSDIDVHVRSFDAASGNWRTRATTDSSGRYLTDGLPGGRYCVTFVPAFGGWAPETYNDAAGCELGATPVIVARGTTTIAEARLTLGGSITGRITTPAGIDRTQIAVTAYGPDRTATAGSVDAAGDYTIANLPPGSYCLGVYTAHFSDLVSTVAGGTNGVCSANGGTISVIDGSATTVNVTPQIGGSISGFAIGPTGRPLDRPEMTVGTSDADRFPFADITTADTDGSYLIRGVPPGRWCVKLSTSARGIGSVVHERALTCAGGAFVTVVADRNVGNVDLSAPAVGVVSGTLHVPAGTIPTSVTITLVPIGGSGTATSVSNPWETSIGRSSVDYAVTAAPGTYCVTASLSASNSTLGTRAATDVPSCDRGPTAVAVRAFEETGHVDIRLRAPTFVPLGSPVRLMDTRVGEPTVDGQAAGLGAILGGTVRELQVAGRGGLPAAATSAVLNVTAVDAAGPGFLTVFPCGGTRPTASNLNVTAGQVVPNLVVTKLGTGGKVCVYAQTSVDVVVDVSGHLPLADTFTALAQPARLMDTRPGEPTVDGQAAGGGAIAAGTLREVLVTGRAGVPSDTSGVVLNVTAIGHDAAGYLTVFPCGATRPTASNLNYVAGQVTPNAVLTKVGVGGKVCLFASGDVDVAVDVSGHVPSTTAFAFLPAPARLMDTRPGEPTVDAQATGTGAIVGGTVREVQVAGRGGVPANAASAVLNVTAVDAVGPGFLTVFPCGTTRPTASNLNYVAGQVTPNAVFTRIGADGKVCVFAQSTVDVVVDTSGSYLS